MECRRTEMPPKKKEKKREFIWRDDEVELLLNIANDCKALKAAESIDWESVKSKYGYICDLFIAALPADDSDVMRSFPHKKEEVTKQIVTSKLKAMRLKFRQAVDSGRKSGHGRVVMIFYELSVGGSLTTQQIDGGNESLEFNSDVLNSQGNARNLSQLSNVVYSSISGDTLLNENSDTPLGDESGGNMFLDNDEENTELEPESNKESGESMKRTMKQRREFLDNKLKNYKQEKLKRKLPVDTQHLGCVQEELKIKRQLVEQMDQMDQRYAENMEKMSRNMEKFTESIADAFALLKQLMMYQ